MRMCDCYCVWGKLFHKTMSPRSDRTHDTLRERVWYRTFSLHRPTKSSVVTASTSSKGKSGGNDYWNQLLWATSYSGDRYEWYEWYFRCPVAPQLCSAPLSTFYPVISHSHMLNKMSTTVFPFSFLTCTNQSNLPTNETDQYVIARYIIVSQKHLGFVWLYKSTAQILVLVLRCSIPIEKKKRNECLGWVGGICFRKMVGFWSLTAFSLF